MRFGWLLGGNLVYALSQWLILVILSRFFETEVVGQYFFSLSLVAPIALLSSLKLSNLVVTLDSKNVEPKKIFGFRIYLDLILLIFVLLFFNLFFYNNTSFLILISVILYKILEQHDDLVIAYFQKNIKFRSIFNVKLFRSLTYVSLIIIYAFLFKNIDKTLFFSTLNYFFIWIILNKKHIYFPFFNKNDILFLFFNGFSLSLSSAISSLNVSGTRLYVGYTLGSSILAIYGVISYSIIIFSILISALGQYFLPFFVENKNIKINFLKIFYKSQILIISISLVCLLISLFFGNELLGAFYGDKYNNYGFYLFLVFFANIFKASSALIGTAMTALKVYDFQLKFTFISLLVMIVSMPLFIINFGLVGAFYSLVFVNIIEWILYAFFVSYKFSEVFK